MDGSSSIHADSMRSTLSAASFAANRAANRSAAPVSLCWQYAISRAVKTRRKNLPPNFSIDSRMRATDTRSTPTATRGGMRGAEGYAKMRAGAKSANRLVALQHPPAPLAEPHVRVVRDGRGRAEEED